jgi:hypothetical protein
MVHVSKNGDMQVAEIAGHKEGQDLAPTILHHLEPASQSLENQVDLVGNLAFSNDILVRRHLASSRYKQIKPGVILYGQVSALRQLFRECVFQDLYSRLIGDCQCNAQA